jgi:hypothetical protein
MAVANLSDWVSEIILANFFTGSQYKLLGLPSPRYFSSR